MSGATALSVLAGAKIGATGATPPVNTVAPAITGTPGVGNVLTCSTGTWTGTPTITYSRQWKSNGVNVGIDHPNYTPVSGDAGHNVTCVVTAVNGAGSVPATSNSVAIPSVLPDLLFDTGAHTMVSAARPGLLVPRVDPIFGTTWMRITNSGTQIAGQPGGVNWGTGHKRHQYMRFSTWSADESLYVMTLNPGGFSGMIIHDGQTGAVLDTRAYPSGWQDYRWFNTEPASMMYCTTSALRKYLPNVGGSASDTLIKTFTPTYTGISIGAGEGEQSRNDDIWPILATKVNAGQPDDGHEVALAYKISTNTILGEVDITALGKSASNSMVAISPSGNYVFIYYNDETTSVYQINGTLVRHVSNLQQPSHGAMALDGSDEMQVGSDRGTGANGEVVKIRLSDGTKTILNDPSFAYHSSASLHLGPYANKWFVTEFYPDSSSPFVSEVILFALDGSALGRCGHTHKGSGSGYDFETHVSHAPFSKRLSLQTDWEGSGNVELYWVDYSAFQLKGFN